MSDTDSLDGALREAHLEADGARLAELYVRAADELEQSGDTDAAGFYLTQGWIFALQSDHPISARIHQRLIDQGRA